MVPTIVVPTKERCVVLSTSSIDYCNIARVVGFWLKEYIPYPSFAICPIILHFALVIWVDCVHQVKGRREYITRNE